MSEREKRKTKKAADELSTLELGCMELIALLNLAGLGVSVVEHAHGVRDKAQAQTLFEAASQSMRRFGPDEWQVLTGKLVTLIAGYDLSGHGRLEAVEGTARERGPVQ